MTEHDSQRAARATHFGFLVLLLVCTAQLAYWMADEYRFTESVRDTRRDAYEAAAASAAALVRAGVPWATIVDREPELELGPSGTPRVSAAALARLDADRFHRMNRYGWEGAFFLSVLVAAIGMVYGALRRERARMHELLERRAREDELAAIEPVLKFGGSEFNMRTHRARSADGAEQLLSEKEAMLLKTLAERAGEVVLRDSILDEVWGDEVLPSSRTVDSFVERLRKRFEPNPERPQFIHTVRGVGYRFTATAETPQR
jgi:DNA-binding winged helix-turn-helix (wHTH) protein